ncbi:hypothetical protein [Erwinia rhapontici]|uniref:hypothetical protein n=1 Tax=Erwinia rhapontici TaxID=55212 RepID=UPI003B9F97CF
MKINVEALVGDKYQVLFPTHGGVRQKMTIRKFSNNSTVIKGFNFSTLAHLGVEGVGLANGGFSISLIVKEENVE